jgi:hypothetical protein
MQQGSGHSAAPSDSKNEPRQAHPKLITAGQVYRIVRIFPVNLPRRGSLPPCKDLPPLVQSLSFWLLCSILSHTEISASISL